MPRTITKILIRRKKILREIQILEDELQVYKDTLVAIDEIIRVRRINANIKGYNRWDNDYSSRTGSDEAVSCGAADTTETRDWITFPDEDS